MKTFLTALLVLTFLALPAKADETEILRKLDAIEKRLTAIEKSNPLQNLLTQGLENLQKQKEQSDQKVDLAAESPPFSVKILTIKSGGKDFLGQLIVDLKVSVTNDGARDKTYQASHKGSGNK